MAEFRAVSSFSPWGVSGCLCCQSLSTGKCCWKPGERGRWMRHSRGPGAVPGQGHVCVGCLQRARPGIAQERGVSVGCDQNREIPACFPHFASSCRGCLHQQPHLLLPGCLEGVSEAGRREIVPKEQHLPAEARRRSVVVQQEGLGAGFGHRRIEESK